VIASGSLAGRLFSAGFYSTSLVFARWRLDRARKAYQRAKIDFMYAERIVLDERGKFVTNPKLLRLADEANRREVWVDTCHALVRALEEGIHLLAQSSTNRDADAGMIHALRIAALLLPASTRGDWLEEHCGYLADLPTRSAKAQWVRREVQGMPRYAYTARTSARKEAA